jgi:transposase
MKDFNTGSVWWVGLDVHADPIWVAILRDTEGEPREAFEIVNESSGLGRLLKKLKGLSGKVRCVYEAGPCGYELYRYLTAKGIACDIAAPSLIPRKPGDRVKTDRRDALKLARAHRSGDLTTIRVPSEQEEAVRDLVRAREDGKQDVLRRRHRLGKFLLRHGRRYREGKAWTNKHSRWLGEIAFDDPHAKAVLEEYRIGLDHTFEQVARLTEEVEKAAQRPEYKRQVARYQTLRGIKTITGMTIATEVGDMRRFSSAPEFMAATGLVPSEYSSGGKERRGGITKTGNAHLRRVLVEAAWHYRHRPTASKALRERRKGQSREVVAIAERADIRLCRKYHKLVDKAKRSTVAVTAVARELAGFIWAIGQIA